MISETEKEPSSRRIVISDRILEFYHDSESAQEAVKRKCGELALCGYVIETNIIHGIIKGSYGKHASNKHVVSTVKHAKIPKNVEINVSPSYLKTGHTLKLDKIEDEET